MGARQYTSTKNASWTNGSPPITSLRVNVKEMTIEVTGC